MQTPMMKIHADIQETVKVFGENIPFVWVKLLLKVQLGIEEEKKAIIDSFTSGFLTVQWDKSKENKGLNYYTDKYNADISPTT
jgi:hypothetical protein